MTYHISRTLTFPFDRAIERTTEELRKEGFGVLTRIDVEATLKQKIGVDFYPYTILGACNPDLAYQALRIEDRIGAMLPCNVIVRETGAGEVEVSAVDPLASMQAIDNPGLGALATTVKGKLEAVIAGL